MVIKGFAKWASVTIPNTRFEHKYTIDLYPDDSPETQELVADLEGKGFPIKTDKEGERYLNIKRKVYTRSGKQAPTPKLMDRQKNPIDIKVGNGSYVAVQFKPWEFEEYKGFELQGVQVLELREYAGADGEEFEEFDDGDEF